MTLRLCSWWPSCKYMDIDLANVHLLLVQTQAQQRYLQLVICLDFTGLVQIFRA